MYLQFKTIPQMNETPESSNSNSAAAQDKDVKTWRERRVLELYVVRISPPCRAVWLYLLQNEIPHTLIDVDFSKGETTLPEVVRKQPHHEVPILVDSEIVVFDGPPILHYLWSEYTSASGSGLCAATRVLTDSIISWANSELHRTIGFFYVYPQFLEKYSMPTTESNEIFIEKGLYFVTRMLEILESKYLSKNKYLTGNRHTMADLYVATILVQLEWPGFKFKLWPKVDNWLSRVKMVEFWEEVHVSHQEYLRELERNRYQFD